MARSGLRQAPAAEAKATSPKSVPPPVALKAKPKPPPVAPEPAAAKRPQAKALPAKRAAAEQLGKISAAREHNHCEPVSALLQVTVGKNLRAARLAAGLTLRQVAELSGILFQYVYKIENGEKNLTLSTIDNLAKVLHVEASDLLRNNPP